MPSHPTRIALISDVHGDVHSLQSALDQIDAQGIDHILCAGDLVGVGLFHEETVQLVRERGILCCRGNWDRWAVGWGTEAEPFSGRPDEPYDALGLGLSTESLRFLAGLPAQLRLEIEGTRIVVCHGSLASDMDVLFEDQVDQAELRGMLDEVGADVLVLGHTHVPMRVEVQGGGMVVNPGALMKRGEGEAKALILEPEIGEWRRDDDEGGTFAVLDTVTAHTFPTTTSGV